MLTTCTHNLHTSTTDKKNIFRTHPQTENNMKFYRHPQPKTNSTDIKQTKFFKTTYHRKTFIIIYLDKNNAI